MASISAAARAARRRSRSPAPSAQLRCASRAATSSAIPSPAGGDGREDGRRPGPRLRQPEHVPEFARGLCGAVAVRLVDDEDVGHLEDPGLGRLYAVAHRRERAARRSCRPARRRRSRTGPTPTVSTRTTSQPAASSTASAWGVAAARPPRCPRVAIDRMNTPASVACSSIRTRSPSSAPPENGDEGSTASTPTRSPRARRGGDERGRGGRLADARGAGQADDVRPAGVRGQRRQRPRAAAVHPPSTSESSRATASGHRHGPRDEGRHIRAGHARGSSLGTRRRRRADSPAAAGPRLAVDRNACTRRAGIRTRRRDAARSARRPGRRRRTARPRRPRRRGA